MDKMREDSFERKLLPPLILNDEELDRSVSAGESKRIDARFREEGLPYLTKDRTPEQKARANQIIDEEIKRSDEVGHGDLPVRVVDGGGE